MRCTSCGICHTPATQQPVTSSCRHRGPVGPACSDHTMSDGDQSSQVERTPTAPTTCDMASIATASVRRTRRAMTAAGHRWVAQVEDTTTAEVECATVVHHECQVWTWLEDPAVITLWQAVSPALAQLKLQKQPQQRLTSQLWVLQPTPHSCIAPTHSMSCICAGNQKQPQQTERRHLVLANTVNSG